MHIIYFKNIEKITKNGIYFLDLGNQINFIDFNKCYENWNRYLGKSNEDNKMNFRCIGQRNSDKDNMFIEFFTKPFTRFEFFENDRGEYNNIKNKIELVGWRTIDLG